MSIRHFELVNSYEAACAFSPLSPIPIPDSRKGAADFQDLWQAKELVASGETYLNPRQLLSRTRMLFAILLQAIT